MDGHTPRRRLFAGVSIDETTRAHCAQAARALQEGGLDARFDPPGNYHLTLAFLGAVEPSKEQAVRASLAACAADVAPFALCVDRIGAFPSLRAARVIWAGSTDDRAFRCAAHAVRERLAPHGFVFQDDAVAHITLGRSRHTRLRFDGGTIAASVMSVDAFSLFEPIPDGPATRYAVLERFALRTLR